MALHIGLGHFFGYEVNGYRFRTTSYDQSRPNRKTTCSGIFTLGLDEVEFIEELKKYMNSIFMVPNLLHQ
jgi:hypothetical protein